MSEAYIIRAFRDVARVQAPSCRFQLDGDLHLTRRTASGIPVVWLVSCVNIGKYIICTLSLDMPGTNGALVPIG